MFSFARNFRAGLLPVTLYIILGFVLPFLSGAIGFWGFAVRHIPAIPGNEQLRFLAGLALTVTTIYLLGMLLRFLGHWAAKTEERARKVIRFVKRSHLLIPYRLTIGFAILSEALDGLQAVRVEEFTGKRSLGFITKVQRIHHPEQRSPWFEFIVYQGDFPSYFLGRWHWYEVRRCQKIIGPLGDLFVMMATVGFGAKSDLYVDDFGENDFRDIEQNLKKRESKLLAAGLVDPDEPITTLDNTDIE